MSKDRQSYDFMQIHLTSIGNLQLFAKPVRISKNDSAYADR